MLLSLSTIFLSASLGLATSTQSSAAAATSAPGVRTAQQFTLVAKVVSGQLSHGPADVNNWVVSGQRLGPQGYASILVDASPLDHRAGRLYQNGTIFDTSCGLGDNNVIASGPLPLAWQILPQDDLYPSNEMLLGQGTTGTGIVRDTSGSPYFVGNGSLDGHFFACGFQYITSTWTPGLNWRAADESRPDGCVDVKLIPQCAGDLDSGTVYTKNLIPAPCVDDAVNYEVPVLQNPNGDGQVVVPFRVQNS